MHVVKGQLRWVGMCDQFAKAWIDNLCSPVAVLLHAYFENFALQNCLLDISGFGLSVADFTKQKNKKNKKKAPQRKLFPAL